MTTAHPIGDHAPVHDSLSVSGLAVEEVEIVVQPFVGFGRLSHLRRQLLELPAVRGARILGYDQGEALFAVAVEPATSGGDLCVPGTRVRAISGGLVYLAADA